MNKWHLRIASLFVFSLVLLGCGTASAEQTPTLLPEPTFTLTPVPTATETPTVPPTADLRPEYQGKRLELQSTETFTLPIEGRQIRIENYGPVVRIYLDANQAEYIEMNVDDYNFKKTTLELGRTFVSEAGKTVELDDMFAVIVRIENVNNSDIFSTPFDVIYAVPVEVADDSFHTSKPVALMHNQVTSFSVYDKATSSKLSDTQVMNDRATGRPVFDIDFMSSGKIQLDGHAYIPGDLVFFQLRKDDQYGFNSTLEGSIQGYRDRYGGTGLGPITPAGSEIAGYVNLVYLSN